VRSKVQGAEEQWSGKRFAHCMSFMVAGVNSWATAEGRIILQA